MNERAIKEAARKYPEYVLSPYDTMLDMECADSVDAIYALARITGGGAIYVPNPRKIFKGCIAKAILNQHKTKTTLELAKMYGYGERHVYELIKNGE